MSGICLCRRLYGIETTPLKLQRWRIVPLLKETVCYKSRYNNNVTGTTANSESKDLPWIQNRKDIFKREPLRHRVLGIFMFRRLLKRAGVPSLEWKDFSAGVKEAVRTIADCISKHDADGELRSYLGSSLLHQYKIAFEELNFENKIIELNIESLKGFHIAGARFIFGHADPGDEYVITVCGQKIIVSKRDLEELEEERRPGVLDGFKYGKLFGEEAFKKEMRFQIDVKFQTFERYSLLDKENSGSSSGPIKRTTPVVAYHRWRFESLIPPPSEVFSLDWCVVDIDEYLKNKYLIPEDSKNGK